MLYWINFLHIYQPPDQEPGVLKQIVDESYNHLLWLMKKYPKLKITLNISGSLLEQFNHCGYLKIAGGIKKLLKQKRIELVGSAMYHPILPILPISEIKRQIQLHNKISKDTFGRLYNPTGFFAPEMAYNKKVAKVIKKMGFKWIILDEIHFPNKQINNEIKYKIKDNGLWVLFRNRQYSKSFPPELIIKNLPQIKDKYLITAHDGEMYGHWHKDKQNYYQKIFTHKKIKTITVSQYLDQLKKNKIIIPKNASWESTPTELKKHIPYALWNDPNNKIHRLLWDLRELAIKAVEGNKKDQQYFWARKHLDRGLSSCSWWWAADKKPDVFSPITWNPTAIEKGLKELINSIRALADIDKEMKLKAEKIYISLIKVIWHKHWKKYA